MLQVNQLSGFGTDTNLRRYNYLGNQLNMSVGSTAVTFSSFGGFGTESSERRILVGIVGRDNTSSDVSSVTIAGVTATLVGRQRNTTNSYLSWAGFYIANIPSGTTGDIVVTSTVTWLYMGIGVWALYGLNSDTQKQVVPGTTVGTTINMSISLTRGDFYFGVHYDQSTTFDTVWTNISEKYDDQVSSGADSIATTTGSVTVSATGSSTSYSAACVCSF